LDELLDPKNLSLGAFGVAFVLAWLKRIIVLGPDCDKREKQLTDELNRERRIATIWRDNFFEAKGIVLKQVRDEEP
jgi:hypothetical protein